MDRWAEEKHSFLKRIKQQKLSRAIAVWWLKADFLLLVDSPQWWNKVLQYSSEHYRKICCLDWETRQESLVVYCPTGARGRPLPWREFSGDDTFLPVSESKTSHTFCPQLRHGDSRASQASFLQLGPGGKSTCSEGISFFKFKHSRDKAKIRSISTTNACFQSSHEVTSGHFTPHTHPSSSYEC